MFREGTCPRCHEKIQVPDDREKILCMYCGEEILVKKALGEEKETDYVAYGEHYNHALQKLQELIGTCYKPMQDFKKNLYEGVFQNFYSSHRSMFEAMEYVYQQDGNPDAWIHKMVSCVLEAAQADLKTLKFKGQKNQRLLDYNFLISVYLIPAVLKYPAEVSEPFADTLIASGMKLLILPSEKRGLTTLTAVFTGSCVILRLQSARASAGAKTAMNCMF